MQSRTRKSPSASSRDTAALRVMGPWYQGIKFDNFKETAAAAIIAGSLHYILGTTESQGTSRRTTTILAFFSLSTERAMRRLSFTQKTSENI